MSEWKNIVKKILNEGRIIKLDHLNPQIVTGNIFIINPTKLQFEKLLSEDKYHSLRGFITDTNELFIWRAYALTHQEALDTLYQKGGYNLNPILGLLLDQNNIVKANSWKAKSLSDKDRSKALNNSSLENIFGKNYKIQNL